MDRFIVHSVEGFVQQVATSYLRHGYWFYVMGHVPAGKDPGRVDEKLIERYGIAMSKWARARRKRAGFANLQYLRYGRTFLLMATKGQHEFFREEGKAIKDVRVSPIVMEGYSIRLRKGPDGKWHSHVRMSEKAYRETKAGFLELARYEKPDYLVNAFWGNPYEPYAPIRRQMLNILRAVNRERKTAGYAQLPTRVVPFKRRIVKPFEIMERRDLDGSKSFRKK